MSRPELDWKKIEEDCAKIMVNAISKNKDIPKSLSSLYAQLKEKYDNEGKKCPTKGTFRQKMRKKLGLYGTRKNKVDAALYRLAGAYDKMKLEMLTDNTQISYESYADQSRWLFVRLNKEPKIKYAETQKHLYALSCQLKEKFSQEIIFISYDRDTLVILCRDNKARKKVAKNFDSEWIEADFICDTEDQNVESEI